MSVITHDGKVAVAENGDALSFDNLIALANQKTGQNNKTLAEVVANIPSEGGGIQGSYTPVSDSTTITISGIAPSQPQFVFIKADKMETEAAYTDTTIVGCGFSAFNNISYIQTTSAGGPFDSFYGMDINYNGTSWNSSNVNKNISSYNGFGYGKYNNISHSVRFGCYNHKYKAGVEYTYTII